MRGPGLDGMSKLAFIRDRRIFKMGGWLDD
jgi:hypothetical protein